MSTTENDNSADYSKLEVGFAHVKVERRRISIQVEEKYRHAEKSEIHANDLEIDYDVNPENLPPNPYPSMQGIFPTLQYNLHLENHHNFADETNVQCFELTGDHVAFHTLDSTDLNNILDTIQQEDPDAEGLGTSMRRTPGPVMERHPSITSTVSTTDAPLKSSTPMQPVSPAMADQASSPQLIHSPKTSSLPSSHRELIDDESAIKNSSTAGRLLVFFVPLTANKDCSFGSQAAIQRPDVRKLFDTLGANPEFLLNLLGRPDYWSPRARWQCNMKNELTMCDYFCQHPRWNTHFQGGAPLSVYMMRRVETKLTAYIISHKVEDSSVHALQQILKSGVNLFGMNSHASLHLTNPFEIAVLLSSLSLEASKFHLGRFRRYMWEQINKVDDHLAGLETSDRGRLTELTKSLQIISQQADSQLLNANVAIITATGIRDAQAKLHKYLSTPALFRQPAEDAIKFVIDSMEKQKMLFLNYKSRKDGTMSLVYNLVTQSDAANNIELAQSMKRDSTSMNAIAALTMVFLPGTFTSSILSAGIFSAGADSKGVSISGLWWFWATLTFPLTLVVMCAWWIYKRRSERDTQLNSQGTGSKKSVLDRFPVLFGKKAKSIESRTEC